jgi:membrane protein implicated in regulation of membrane protease activity
VGAFFVEDNMDILGSFLLVLEYVFGNLEWVFLGKLCGVVFAWNCAFESDTHRQFALFFISEIASIYLL